MRCPLCSAQIHEDDLDLCQDCDFGWLASPECARQFTAWKINGGIDQRDGRWEPVHATALADYVRRVQSERAHGGRA